MRMGKFDALVAIFMIVSIHNYALVDSYLVFGCTTSDITPFPIFGDRRELENFPRGGGG